MRVRFEVAQLSLITTRRVSEGTSFYANAVSRFRSLAHASGYGITSLVAFGWLLGFPSFGDWPGLLGPNRDGHASPGAQVANQVPKELRLKWELDAGQGYAGAAIRDDQVALFQRDGNQDVLRLVAAADGRVLWKATFPAKYRKGIDEDTGPRSVPQILEDAVLVHAASGALHCVSRRDGQVRWSRELRSEYGAEDGYFGAGNAPLVVGEIVVINVGGKKKKAGIVGLSLADGKTVWQGTDAGAGYASPILVETTNAAGVVNPIAVVPTRLKTYGIQPLTGKVLWEFPFGQRGPTVNAATPILTGAGHLFQTSSYGIGFVTAKLGDDSIEILKQGDTLASQYATPVAVGEYVFGSDGREDLGSGAYKCLRADTGEVAWSDFALPICHTIAIGEGEQTQLLLVGIDGRVWLCPARPDKFKPIWQSRLPMGKYRGLPAFSNHRLIVRSCVTPDAKWYCVEL